MRYQSRGSEGMRTMKIGKEKQRINNLNEVKRAAATYFVLAHRNNFNGKMVLGRYCASLIASHHIVGTRWERQALCAARTQNRYTRTPCARTRLGSDTIDSLRVRPDEWVRERKRCRVHITRRMLDAMPRMIVGRSPQRSTIGMECRMAEGIAGRCCLHYVG